MTKRLAEYVLMDAHKSVSWPCLALPARSTPHVCRTHQMPPCFFRFWQ